MKRYSEGHLELNSPEVKAWLKKNDKQQILVQLFTKNSVPVNFQGKLMVHSGYLGMIMKMGGASFSNRFISDVTIENDALVFLFDKHLKVNMKNFG